MRDFAGMTSTHMLGVEHQQQKSLIGRHRETSNFQLFLYGATYNKKHMIPPCNTTARKQELTFNEHRLSRTRSLAKQTNDLPPLCWKAAYMFCLRSDCAPICHLLGSWTRKCRRLKKTPSGGLLQDSAWGTLMNIILYNCRIHEMHCSPFEQVQNAFLILWIYIHVLTRTFDPLVIKMLWLVFHVKNVVKRKDVLFLQPMFTWIIHQSLLCIRNNCTSVWDLANFIYATTRHQQKPSHLSESGNRHWDVFFFVIKTVCYQKF